MATGTVTRKFAHRTTSGEKDVTFPSRGLIVPLLDSSETYFATIGHPISVSSVLGSNQLATESLIFLVAYTKPPEDQLDDFAGK